MITLRDNETILLTLHRHWIIIFARTAFVLLLGAFPLAGIFFAGSLEQFIRPESAFPFLVFISALWWLVLLLFFFIEWLEYWLDSLIVTDLRIIRINQKSLFWREVSEFMLSRVENITIETPGILGAFFQFGNIAIETAGEMNFEGRTMQNLQEAKNIILEYAEKNRGHK